MTFFAFVVIPTLVFACILAPVLLGMGESGTGRSDSGDGPPPGNGDDPKTPSPTRGDSAAIPLSSITVDTPPVPSGSPETRS
ncbi:MAG: hypothetical protein PPP56_05725 [Longimonas sp.]|uniref:hypothetical protein n=1 Tax=Longimonas sp. TaxID=2039626 RepID=UPI0033503039